MLGNDVHSTKKRQARMKYLFFEGDPYTDAIFYMPGATHISALTSRFVVDLNRRRNEDGPNGVIKLTDFNNRRLYPKRFTMSNEAKEQRLKCYWDPFHARIDTVLKTQSMRFFIDAHSMTPQGPSIGPDHKSTRPAFTIMTGGNNKGKPSTPEGHTSISAKTAKKIVSKLNKHFSDIIKKSDVPKDILINDPFAVGGIQQRLSDPAYPNALPGFALEFNRNLYLREGKDGWDELIPGRTQALNARFQAFVMDILPLFDADAGGA